MTLIEANITVADALSYVATVRYQSISRAADVLGLTQPSVTRRIQALEEELGVVLLDRNTRPPKPTAIGLRVFEKCEDIIKEAQALKSLVDVAGTPRGSVRIGITQRIAELGLARLLLTFAEQYPDVHVQATTRWSAELIQMVGNYELHAAVLQAPASAVFPEGVLARKLMPIDVPIVVPKGRFARGKTTLARCAAGPWILNPEGCVFRRRLINAIEDAGLPYKVAVDGFGTEMQMQLVARGLGFGLLPSPCIESSVYRSEVAILKLSDFQIQTTLWLVHNDNLGNLTRTVDTFGQSISATMQAVGADPKRRSNR